MANRARSRSTPADLVDDPILLALGRIDDAFTWLHVACNERAGEMIYLNVDPDCDSIRSDPQFERLLRRVGFPA
jgi:hypothetical protein